VPSLKEIVMTKLDWFKAILGALIAVPIMYAMMVIIMVL
jgi:hypothetical protein